MQMGICGSDIHYYLHGTTTPSSKTKFPIIIGHECAGIIEAVSDPKSKFKKGDKVFIEPNIHCQKCDMCKQGKFNLCRNGRFLGFLGQKDGCLQEFIIMPEHSLFKLPRKLSWTE